MHARHLIPIIIFLLQTPQLATLTVLDAATDMQVSSSDKVFEQVETATDADGELDRHIIAHSDEEPLLTDPNSGNFSETCEPSSIQRYGLSHESTQEDCQTLPKISKS